MGISGPDVGTDPGETAAAESKPRFEVERIRGHFDFVGRGRIVTNNAATTQSPRELVELLAELVPGYESVHRGRSTAARLMTDLFESAYDTIAQWINAPSRRNIAIYRNTTEAHNAVMYSMLTEFRDGDNVVTTRMEHNSNYVPWYGMTKEILEPMGRHVEYRLVDFDRATGELDLDHMAHLVDNRTKLICCTGASNFLGTKPPLADVRAIADGSGYEQPDSRLRSLLLVDGAQLVPSNPVDVAALDVDWLSFSFHKILAPFGVGVLYGKEDLIAGTRPFLYGGDMIADGGVWDDHIEYADLPWRSAAGTPAVLEVIVSGQALRLLVDMVSGPDAEPYFRTERSVPRSLVSEVMSAVRDHTKMLTSHAMEHLSEVGGITLYGPPAGQDRSPLVAFNVEGWSPYDLADGLDLQGVEARAGCHCASLAHRWLGLAPQATCRLSFALYNTINDVDRAVNALCRLVELDQRPDLVAQR
ncbi:MAG TPA: aminotransferase class V-fold PLP-dependent enzyme [Acidimicrobiia bacterium]|nr:aminotransferase class V-fold PLP-dependent enzyme [Acidimicrobiia bacterium]